MYIDKVYEYHLKNSVLNGLIKQHLPKLYNHLVKKLGVQFEMITTSWIMTMFMGYIDKKDLFSEDLAWHLQHKFIECRILQSP